MRLQLRLNLRRLVLALIALLSFGAILLKQSDGYLRASAAVQTVKSVNAASYEAGPLARGSLASVFGNNLASRTGKSQDATPPTKLGDVTVRLTGSDNVTRDAGLVLVSEKQINFVIPDEMPTGKTQMVIKNGDKDAATGEFQVVDASPALFTSDSGGGKSAVGVTSANGSTTQSIVNSDGSPSMIGPGAPWAPTTITLLGTGIRYASDVQVRIGGQLVEPMFFRPASAPGVDEVAFRMPTMSRAGMNTLSLVVNTRSSATASSGATTLAAGAAQSSDTTVTSNAGQVNALGPAAPSPFILSAADVQTIIAQAVAKAQQLGVAATIAVVDKEANVLGLFKMNGARSGVLLGRTDLRTGQPSPGSLIQDPDGLERVSLPLATGLGLLSDGAALAAISKAGTPAFFCTQGSSISTRTASFIIGENFPRRVSSQASGPLFGVQFSSLPCSDFRGNVGLATLPLGLSGDSGGFGIYKNGVAVGGVGVEQDGFYTVDIDPTDRDQPVEEFIAMAATNGYRPPPAIQANNILIDGVRFDFSNVQPGGEPPAAPYASLVGPVGSEIVPPTGQFVSRYTPLTLGGVPGRVILDPNPGNPSNIGRQGYFPFKSSQVSSLTASDVNTIITQAAQQAYRSRAAIRLPVGPNSPVEVNITVVDTSGAVLGEFSTIDAPEFGFDVSAQKARTAVFFSLPTAAAMLLAADANITNVQGLSVSKYAGQAAAFGVPLNGQFAFTSRAMGFLARTFFPDGIPNTPNGPFSKPITIWSEFNDGLQIAAVKPALVSILTNKAPANLGCSPLPNDLTLANGFQIFAGSSALYKNGVLVGAIGISGDGIDQDDLVSAGGSFGYDPPAAVRADQLLIRTVRLPYRKYPRHPNIGNPPPTPPIIRNTRAFSNTN